MTKQWICGLALALCVAPSLFGQAADTDRTAMPECAAMMQQQSAMQTHMGEMNAKLDLLVAEMNKAKGSAKVDKAAAVITELVAQRAMMQKHMMEMQPKMMDHMMTHMKSGMDKGMSSSMSGCPMMKHADKGAQATPSEHKH